MKTFNQYFNKNVTESLDENYKPVIAPTAQQLGIKMKGGFAYHLSVIEDEEENVTSDKN